MPFVSFSFTGGLHWFGIFTPLPFAPKWERKVAPKISKPPNWREDASSMKRRSEGASSMSAGRRLFHCGGDRIRREANNLLIIVVSLETPTRLLAWFGVQDRRIPQTTGFALVPL